MANLLLQKISKRKHIFSFFLVFIILILSVSIFETVNSNSDNSIRLENMHFLHSQRFNNHQMNWVETAKLITLDGSSNDWFGISVDIDGDYSVVGARDDDGERGSAYVFRRDGNIWVQDQKLLATDGVAGDWFGISVSIKDDIIFVGADADDNENGVNAGSVYVFRHNDSSWIQQNKLLASDGTANDYFGRYVSLDTDYAVIGAYYDDDITGSAYVFKRDGLAWIEEDKLTASDGAPGDYFGISTSIYGDYVIVGAYRDDNINGIDAGSVYIFKKTENGWIEEKIVISSDGAANDRFGISTSLDREYMVIGAYYDDANIGSAYVFKNTTSGWVEEKKLVASDGETDDFFGRSVSIGEQYLLVGAWGDSGYSGSVYVFKHNDMQWIEENKLSASDGASNDRFGYEVFLDGRCTIIGAYLDDNNNGIDAGCAYIFTQETENHPPEPPTIYGPIHGKVGNAYNFSFSTTDPENDDVYLYIDWGDSSTELWIGPYNSGEMVTITHIWIKKDTYLIKSKAKDSYGNVSDFSALEITIPRNQFFILKWEYPLFSRLFKWILA